ncbi:EcsC family protein [Loktanella sp. R86503]|uniref:EcsC family protein n=1 Tax=Loktanella sp. R86503 TaxID=3093847 RepID=UPI0036DE6ED7
MKTINADLSPKAPLGEAERARIRALAERQRRANGILMRAINFVGSQVEDTMKLLPKGARGQIDAAARSALAQSYEVAAKSRSGSLGQAVNTDRMHKVMATLSGAVGGFGGLPTALAELPVATTMIFRAVQGVAAQYGEDPADPETRLHALAVFGAGEAGEDGVDTSFLGARLGLSGAAVHTLIARVAPRFAAVLTQKLATQAVPILGAAAGAGTNYAFTQYYVEMAHVHFGLRKMLREHDAQEVENIFHTALEKHQVTARGD